MSFTADPTRCSNAPFLCNETLYCGISKSAIKSPLFDACGLNALALDVDPLGVCDARGDEVGYSVIGNQKAT